MSHSFNRSCRFFFFASSCLRVFPVFFLIAPVLAQTTRPTTNPALWDKLVAFDKENAKIADLTADFEQQKHTPLLKRPMVSSGTIKVRGPAMRWDTLKPSPTIMRVDEKSVSLYYPKQKTMETFPIEGQLGSLAASPVPKLDVLSSYFAFYPFEYKRAGLPAGVTLVRMEPISPEIAEHVKEVQVILDNRGLVWEFQMTDADGERTVINFTNLKTDVGLNPEDVELKTPADTKIVKPLENLAPGK
jgi:outer membrane lipoprotein-sorting protein